LFDDSLRENPLNRANQLFFQHWKFVKAMFIHFLGKQLTKTAMTNLSDMALLQTLQV
jgi:hypothetical protein